MSGRMRAATGMMAAALLAGCASKPAPAPRPEPVARPAPPPQEPPAPPPVAAADDWRDLELTPGDWSYASSAGGSEARFAGFTLRCDSAARRVAIARDGVPGALRLRTSFGDRTMAAGSALPAADPVLDEIVFSRGRFVVEAEGMERLVLPTWPEPARAIEDCRG